MTCVFQTVSGKTTKLLNKLSLRRRTAFRCTSIDERVRGEVEFALWKSGVTNHAPLSKRGVAPAILGGNIEDATSWKFMAGTKESNIAVASEPMCLSHPPHSPLGYSHGANRNGEGRTGILEKAKRFSRHSKRALRAYIWRVGGLQIAPAISSND